MESFKEDTQAFCLLPRRKVAACTILVYNRISVVPLPNFREKISGK